MRSPALPNNKLGGYLSIFWNPKTSHSASKIMTKGSSWSLLINNYFIHKSRINESTTNTTHKVNLRKPVWSNKDLQLYFQLLQLLPQQVNLPTETQKDLWILKLTPQSAQGPNTRRLHQIKLSCPRVGRRVMLPGDIRAVSALHQHPVRSTPTKIDRNWISHYHIDSLTSRQMMRINKMIGWFSFFSSKKDARDFMKQYTCIWFRFLLI